MSIQKGSDEENVHEKAFPFLDLPQELRDEVYKYFVAITYSRDNAACEASNDNLNLNKFNFDIRILHVCKQMRDEGLKCMKNKNDWFLIAAPSNKLIELQTVLSEQITLPQPFSRHEQLAFIDSANLTLNFLQSFGDRNLQGGVDIGHQMLFAYDKGSYQNFVRRLISSRLANFTILDIVLNPKNVGAKLDAIIEDRVLPLVFLRDLHSVTSYLTGHYAPLLTMMAKRMTKLSLSSPDLVERLLALKEEACHFSQSGHFTCALDLLTASTVVAYECFMQLTQSSYPYGTPQNLALRSLYVDVCIEIARVRNAIMAQKFAVLKRWTPVMWQHAWIAIDHAKNALAQLSATQAQRCKAHFQVGQSYVNLMKCYRFEGRPKLDWSYNSVLLNPHDNSLDSLTDDATRHFVWSMQAADDGHHDYQATRRMCSHYVRSEATKPAPISFTGLKTSDCEENGGGDHELEKRLTGETHDALNLIDYGLQVKSQADLYRIKRELRIPGNRVGGLLRLLDV